MVWVDKNTRDLQKSLPTFIVVQQPKDIWTNGDDSCQRDSTHQTGLVFIFQEVLIVVQSGGGAGGQKYSGSSKSPPTFIVVQQPEEQWPNRDDSAIQCIELVWNSSFKKF
jgi:hypothetical protein